MFQVTPHWALLLLVSLFAIGISVADDTGGSDLQHKIRTFRTDMPILLDGDLVKWLVADTVTFSGKPLAGHPRQLREEDGVEFLIDPLLHRTKDFLPDDFSYHINILNAVYDDRGTPSGQPDPRWNGSAQHVVRVLNDYHYALRVSIPWKEIDIEPVEGRTVLRIDFGVNGKDLRGELMAILIEYGLKYSMIHPVWAIAACRSA
jgi:hypothetical protein